MKRKYEWERSKRGGRHEGEEEEVERERWEGGVLFMNEVKGVGGRYEEKIELREPKTREIENATRRRKL